MKITVTDMNTGATVSTDGWEDDPICAVRSAIGLMKSKQFREITVSDDNGAFWRALYVDEDGEVGFVCTEFNVDVLDDDDTQYDDEWFPTKEQAVEYAKSIYAEGGIQNILVYEYRVMYDLDGEFQYLCDAYEHECVFSLGN